VTAVYSDPVVVRWDGPERPELRARVERAVAAGVSRAIAASGQAASAGTATRPEAGAPAATAAAGPDPEGGLLVVPSYDAGGAPVGIPVRPPAGHTVAHGDRIVPEAFASLPVLRISVSSYVTTGGSSHVLTPSFARALGWGRVLYGGLGFVILERKGSRGPDRFATVPLAEPFRAASLGRGGPQVLDDPDAPAGLQDYRHGELFPLAGYWVVMLTATDGDMIFGVKWGTPWRPGAVVREYRRTPAGELVDPADAAREATAMLTAGPEPDREATLRAGIVDMDRTVFAFIAWRERAGYLATLAGVTWPSAREQKAMIELVAAARSRTELEAMFAILRQRGAFDRLFAKLDGSVVELLLILGDWRPPGPVSVGYVIALFTELGLAPGIRVGKGGEVELLRQARNLLDGLALWVRSTVSGIRELFDHTATELAEGVAHLVEFAMLFQRATSMPPDLLALATLAQLAVEAGKTIRKAMAGLAYAEELGSPAGQRGGAQVTIDLLDRLRTALAVEILTWFVGIGEVKEVLAAANVPGRLADLVKLLGSLGRLGKAAEVLEEATKLERLLAVLVRLAGLRDATAAARALRLLPTGHLTELVRLAELLDVPAGGTARALRAAAKGKGVMKEVQELADALSLARRIERRAAAAGGVTAEMTDALRRLLETGWDRRRLGRLLDAVPEGQLQAWSRALGALNPAHLERLGAQGLERLAYSPRSLAFVAEAGGDAYVTALSRFRGDTRAVESLVQGLELRKAELGDPIRYQELLDRIAAGEVGAFEEIAARISAAAEAALGRLRSGGRSQLLAELEEFEEAARRATREGRAADAARQLAARDRLAARLGELGDKELDGLEHIARIGEERGLVNWDAALDLAPADRAELLTLVDDVAGSLPLGKLTGIEDVLRNLLERNVSKAGQLELAVQGSWGQLYAARTLVRDLGATALEFEAARPGRVVDIIADLPGKGRVSAEVKTNLGEAASMVEHQVINDLVTHAPTDYGDMLYLYHPSVAGQLPELGQKMLALFDQPELPALLKAAGTDPVKAKAALEAWLAGGGLRTYAL
jgi:hypothetical protein